MDVKERVNNYPNSTIMEVQADNAGGQGVVLLNPSPNFVLDDAFSIRACMEVVSERQQVLRRQHVYFRLFERGGTTTSHPIQLIKNKKKKKEKGKTTPPHCLD